MAKYSPPTTANPKNHRQNPSVSLIIAQCLARLKALRGARSRKRQHNCAEREQADRSLGGDDQMNLFPQRGKYLDCNFLNAASGSLVTPRVRRLKRNPLDKKEFLMTFVLPDRRAAK